MFARLVGRLGPVAPDSPTRQFTPPGIIGRTFATPVALAVTIVLALTPALPPTTGMAQADPSPSPAADTDATLSWPSLGLPGSLTLVGANGADDVKVPVPTGFGVKRLQGLIHAPVDFTAGFVEIDDGRGAFLAAVELPSVTPGQAVVPFDVDISAAQESGSTAGLSFSVREQQRAPEQRCGLGERLELSDLAVVFGGSEPPPATVAAYVPPVLQRLAIYSPIDADGAEQQAVLTLVSAFARMYAPQSTAISVIGQPRGAVPPPAPQFTRAVLVESGDAGLTVVNPGRSDAYLKVSGRGDQLTDQASLVGNRLQSLVQVPNARVESAEDTGAPASDELSFGQLKMGGKTTVLRTSDLTVGVDRSALGTGRVDGLKVHLLATHTPVAGLDSASVVVNVNGEAVYTSALGDSGRIDAVFDVPADLLRQRINFDFSLTYSPRQLCSPTIAPLTFQLDPRSTLTMRRGGRALGGFSAVPSEFSPEFLVALDGSDRNQLDYASQVIADIARSTGTSLRPRIVDVDDAADATTGALIVASAATIDGTSLRPPIGGKGSGVRVDLQKEVRADLPGGLGSVQAFADQPRDRTVVLVATSGAWSLAKTVLDYIAQTPGGWTGLDGNVLAAGPGGTVTNLSTDLVAPAPSEPRPGLSWPIWLAIGTGAAFLIALALRAAFSSRRRNLVPRQSTTSPPPA